MSDTAAPTPDLSPEACAAYQALCSFCSWVLYDDPEPDALRGLATERMLFCEPPFSQVAPDDAAAFGGLLAALAPDAGEGGPAAAQTLLDEVRRDRSYLFYMVGASHASPYESVYRTDDHTMMGPATLEVRAAYRAHGLVFERAASEPDDHVGLEFSFAAHLLGRAAEGETSCLADCRDFLGEHLLTFAPAYLDVLEQRARSPYYRLVARIARATLTSLADALGAHVYENLPN